MLIQAEKRKMERERGGEKESKRERGFICRFILMVFQLVLA